MNVVAINSSPLGDKGHTAMILTPFLEGMKDSGAKVSLYFTKDLKINPCCGQFTCSINKIDCFQKDDMKVIHPKLLEANIWIFATPLYLSTINGPMKTFMDRMLIPWGEPFVTLQDGRSHHPMRKKHENGNLRPHAPIMKYMQGQEEELEKIKKAAYESGKKVINVGKLDTKLLETISHPLIPIENYVRT
ncbi:MAG: flavodoxin family protein [Candidatus Heimdallarchaeota archaeon]